MSKDENEKQAQPRGRQLSPEGKLFVMCEISERDEAEDHMRKLPKDHPMVDGKLITEMPLARLVDGDGLCCIVRKGPTFVPDEKMGRRPVPGPLDFTPVQLVADHWDGDPRGSGRVRSAGFLNALGKTILPCTIKRNDPKRDEDTFRIAYA
jgi:hypothetical protein